MCRILHWRIKAKSKGELILRMLLDPLRFHGSSRRDEPGTTDSMVSYLFSGRTFELFTPHGTGSANK